MHYRILQEAVIHVLLVEDDETDALLFGYAVEEMVGLKLYFAHTTRLSEAETLLSQCDFDIVLLDMGLPDADGLNGLARLQQSAPQLPIILLTSFNDESRALEALQHGAEDYLIKGKTDAPLLERSMRYASGSRSRQPRQRRISRHDFARH